VPPVVRLTNLGLRRVAEDVIEAADAFGSTPRQRLFKVQIPQAMPSILAGVNQTIMAALGIVVIAALIGAGGLGREVLVSLQRLEVGRALATQPKVLLLDEPASGQDESETERFGEFLLELAAEGLAILMVEHDVPLVMRVCGQIVVLDFGQVIARGTPEEIQADEAVLDAYLGSATGEVG